MAKNKKAAAVPAAEATTPTVEPTPPTPPPAPAEPTMEEVLEASSPEKETEKEEKDLFSPAGYQLYQQLVSCAKEGAESGKVDAIRNLIVLAWYRVCSAFSGKVGITAHQLDEYIERSLSALHPDAGVKQQFEDAAFALLGRLGGLKKFVQSTFSLGDWNVTEGQVKDRAFLVAKELATKNGRMVVGDSIVECADPQCTNFFLVTEKPLVREDGSPLMVGGENGCQAIAGHFLAVRGKVVGPVCSRCISRERRANPRAYFNARRVAETVAKLQTARHEENVAVSQAQAAFYGRGPRGGGHEGGRGKFDPTTKRGFRKPRWQGEERHDRRD